MDRADELSMSRCSLMAMNDSQDGYHCSRCGGHSDDGSSQDHEFNTPLTEEVEA